MLVLSVVYLQSYYDSEKNSLENALTETLDYKVEMINKSLADTEANLGYIEAYAHLALKYNNVARDEKSLAQFLSRIIAPYKDQYNAYVVWNAQKSHEICQTAGCANVVRKNQKFFNSNAYGNLNNIEYVRYKDPFYQIDNAELWYYLPQKSTGVVYTPVYFDTNYMKIYMFSCVKAIFEKEKFVGVIGIDMPILNFTQSISEFEKAINGYAYLTDQDGHILDQFASSRGIGRINAFKDIPHAESRGQMQEITASDRKIYLYASKKIPHRNWQLVVYKDKGEAYYAFNKRLTILVVIGLVTILFLGYASLWVGNVLAQEVGELQLNLEENSKILDKSSQGIFNYKKYSNYTLEEFSNISELWNSFLFKLKDAIQRYHDEKQKADIAKQTQTIFLANMSHEIRTPMNAILGMAEVLSETKLNAEQRKYVTVFENSARGLLQIINQILDMSRVEIGEIQIENAAFSLVALTDEIQVLFENRVRQKDIKLHVSIDSKMAARIIGDSLRIKQVIVNLVANAFKFTMSGEVKIEIILSSNHQFQIRVIDTGIGISDENRLHIFERFTQADASIARRFGGTGLGLSISKSLAQLMGGDIEVISQDSKGSTFTVTLPYFPASSADLAVIEKPLMPTLKVYNKFLVVDDVPENQMVVSLYLKSLKINFDLANNGQEACEMALKNPYDLIIMDIQMPVMDGVEALKQIRIQEKEQNKTAVPIVALSAFAMEHEQKRYLDEGFDGYLTKPVRKSELLKMINSKLG